MDDGEHAGGTRAGRQRFRLLPFTDPDDLRWPNTGVLAAMGLLFASLMQAVSFVTGEEVSWARFAFVAVSFPLFYVAIHLVFRRRTPDDP